MAEQLLAVERLPSQYGELAAGFRQAAAALTRRSAPSVLGGILPTNVFFGQSDIRTRLTVTRERERLVFGFLRRKDDRDVILDATVSFRIEAGERYLPPLRLASILHFAILPPFFDARMSAEEAAEARAVLKCESEDVFFLRIDVGVLAVVAPGDYERARTAWLRTPGAPWNLSVNHFVPNSSAPREWQVPPFLALARTIGLWTRNGFEVGEPLPITLPEKLDLASEKTTFYVLRQLCSAWVEASNSIDKRERNAAEPGPTAEQLALEYVIEDYQAQVLLRLDSEGRLARKGDREDLFLLQATLRLNEDEHGVARSHIAIGPPDFLSAGPLYEKFLNTLEGEDAAAKLEKELGLSGDGSAVRDFVRSARSSTRDAPLVFRVKRGRRRDTDLITLHGTLNGLLQHVVLKGDFDVEAGEDPHVVVDVGSIEALYTDRPRKGKPPSDSLPATEVPSWLDTFSGYSNTSRTGKRRCDKSKHAE